MRTLGMWIAGLLALGMFGGIARAETASLSQMASAQVEESATKAYGDALARFDAAQAARPNDASIAVERCEFISRFTDEDYGIFVGSAAEDLEACKSRLEKRFPKSPEVALYKLDRQWDEEAILREGEPLLDLAPKWPAPLSARLYAKLADAGAAKADEFALEALRLDPDVIIDETTLARAWLHTGHPEKAAEAIKGLQWNSGPLADVRFDIALAKKDWPTAVGMIEVSDTDDFYPNLRRFGRLAAAAPSTLLSGKMPVLLFAVIAMGLGLAALPVLLLVPVHYRGMARRLQHRIAPAPMPRVTLWHAWYGAAIALAMPSVLMVFVAPQLLDGGTPRMGPALFTLMLWSMSLSLLAMVPVLGVFGKRGLLGDRDLWRSSWKRILGYWVVLVAIVFALNALFALTGTDTTTEQTRMVAALAEQAKGTSGVMLTLCIVALLGPIFEELVFRGLLLNGMARHLNFRWANFIQAFAFACMHTDPPRFVFYFAMGLFGGWLVRRTGSIAPAIALHVLNNAWAIGLLIAVK